MTVTAPDSARNGLARPVAVTVVIATRNDAGRVGLAILSVINQTFNDFELIVVNDASTDETAPVLERFLEVDSRLSVLTNATRLGRAGARNAAITAARGEFIAVLDSDDMMFPERLTRQVDFLRRNESIGILGTPAVFEVGGSYYHAAVPGDIATIRNNLSNGQNNAVLNSSVLCRRSVLLAIGGYRSSEYSPLYNEDYITFRNLLSKTEFANLAEPLILVTTDGLVNPAIVKAKLREMTRYELHTLVDRVSMRRLARLVARGMVVWLPDSLFAAMYRFRLRAMPVSRHAKKVSEFKRQLVEQDSAIRRVKPTACP